MKKVRVDELKRALKLDVVEKFSQSIESSAVGRPLNFLEESKSDANTDMYDIETSIEIYRNFLEWLFATFNEEQETHKTSDSKKEANSVTK